MNENNTTQRETAGSRMPFVCPCMYYNNTYMQGTYGPTTCPFMCCPFMTGAFTRGAMPEYNMFGRGQNIPFPESQE